MSLLKSKNFGVVRLRSEAGVSSVVTFLAMLMLATIGFTLHFMTMSDSKLTTRKLQTTQAFYLAESGLEFAMMQLNSATPINETQPITIENAVVNLDTSIDETGGIMLVAEAHVQDLSRRVGIIIQNKVHLGNFAIYSTGDVDNVTTLDEEGNEDPDLLTANADSLPPIDYVGLTDMAISQGHLIFDAVFTPDDGYPNGDFYFAPDVPNVIHVINDFKVLGNRTVYGIYIVEGDVTLNGGARVEGIIYLPNLDSEILQITVTGGGDPEDSSVMGGIIANGDVRGTGSHISVQYIEEYMQYFGEFEKPSDTYHVVQWMEL